MDLFLYDRHHLEHAGFICAKASSCCVIGGSCSNAARNGDSFSRFGSFKTPPRVPPQGDFLGEVRHMILVEGTEVEEEGMMLWAYEAPTPGSGWASTPGSSYSEAGTPKDSGSQT
ncbi:hypothetical protein V6N11_078966 [Hibiscus sabdariffa]|uniref:Uncharacterized protein n=1 Tax=Hibiscus sabdariffa TaxID=183260 RepID=A0ABR2RU12_9ROSI